jgi:hypothetical protein
MQHPSRFGLPLAVAAMLAVSVSVGSAHAAAASTALVEPSSTGVGITAETNTDAYHRVVVPDGARGRPLVVVIGGTNSTPSGYDDFSAHAADLGYPVVNLRYPNAFTVASVCQQSEASDRCFANIRGEIVFGAGTPDPTGAVYSSEGASVDAANSIVGRMIALLDHLAAEDGYWNRYLISDPTSPYVATHRGPVRLDHKKLILTGHSQGGGHAAFWAMRAAVERVVMLGSPDDTAHFGLAPWIRDSSATPLDRYWGIRHQAEGQFGQNVPAAWNALGGGGVGAGDDTSEVDVGDGSGSPDGSHRLVLTVDQGGALLNHLSMAYDAFYLAGVPDAWTYVLASCPARPGHCSGSG